MDRHFSCTSCGKCCYGMLPLTIDDAFAHADRFPLMLIWSPVRQGGRSFEATAEIGVTIQLKKKKRAAVRISPTAYIPPSLPCPELTDEGLCRIHDAKPQRCRTMPLSAYRDESDQDDLLIPRPGWLCDTSETAPLVYRDRAILDRTDFAAERKKLVGDAAILKPYGEWILKSVPTLRQEVHKMAMKPRGGQVIVSFATLVPRLPQVDIYELADKQAAVMADFADRTADQPDLAGFHRRYAGAAKEWFRVLEQRPA